MARWQDVRSEIKASIDAGILAVHAPVPSENELIQHYGVSRGDARKILVGLAEDGYILRSKGRRSVVAPATSRMSRPRLRSDHGARTVALAMPTHSDTFTINVLHGFTREASRAGWEALTFNLHVGATPDEHFLRQVQQAGFQGVALFLPERRPQVVELLRELIQAGMPVVLVDRYLPDVETDFVVTDNRRLARHIVRELCAHGHRRIGFISVGEWLTSVGDRFQGYLDALNERGVTFDPAWHMDVSETPLDVGLYRMLALREAPTALFSSADIYAFQSVPLLQELGYDIPEHFEVGTVDDGPFCRQCPNTPFVSAQQDGFEMGAEAARTLLARIENPKTALRRVYVPPLLDAETEDS